MLGTNPLVFIYWISRDLGSLSVYLPARASNVRAAKSNLCLLVTADRLLEGGPLAEAALST